MLLSLYLENTKEFNIKIALKKVMNIYNNTFHKTIKFSPNEVFYNKNIEFHKIIYNNL